MSHDQQQFEARQGEVAREVDRRLEHWLARRPDVPDRLTDAMAHATLGGGKRFRALLVVEGARICGGDHGAALDVAAALECVHAYSLVHDDLPAMDNDQLRRGKPTVWKAYDEWTAILAGDALLTLAFEIIAGLEAVEPTRRARLVAALARDAGRAGMVGGQGLDLEAEKLGLPRQPTLAHIERLQAMKTGALIRFACEAGAMLGDARHQARFARYGAMLGLAFQISDDLLDVEGDAALIGKAVDKDQRLGKATLVSLMGVKAARRRLAEVVAAAVVELEQFGKAASVLRGAAQFMLTRRQ